MEANSASDEDDTNRNTRECKSLSHTLVNQVKHDELRTSKSSPHRNLELHHTRSFAEICHLHPSTTELNVQAAPQTQPRSKTIDALQREHVQRPESVLEMSDYAANDSEDETEEDVYDAQMKGDEAMRMFLESNMSVPLEGALTSSSGSLPSQSDSDTASEEEMFIASWDDDGRASVTSSGTNINKLHPLTLSGQLLHREQQVYVDSMFDTKRLKLTPSTSSSGERPMSPLAMKTDDDVDSSDGGKSKKEDETSKCDCGLYNKLQDLQRLVKEYEIQYEEIVKRRGEQSEELKVLRKDNINLHREQNRLHMVIKESSKYDEIVQELTQTLSCREKELEDLKSASSSLQEDATDRESEIFSLKTTIARHEREIAKYDAMFKDISNETNALIEAIGSELGNDEESSTLNNDNKNLEVEKLLPNLKKRRCSLKEDFRNFTETLLHPTSDNAVGENCDTRMNDIQKQLHENFNQMATGCRQALLHVKKTEESVETIQQKAVGLESMLLRTVNLDQEDTMEYSDSENPSLQTEKGNSSKEDHLLIVNEINQLQSQLTDHISVLHDENHQAQVKLEDLEATLNEYITTSCNNKETENVLRQETDEARQEKLEDSLKQISHVIEELSNKMDKAVEQVALLTNGSGAQANNTATTTNRKEAFSSDFLWQMKEVYAEHFDRVQEHFAEQKKENESLREKLRHMKSEEEVNMLYMASLKRANSLIQEELRASEEKCEELKKQLRELNDRVLVTDARQRMLLYLSEKAGSSS